MNLQGDRERRLRSRLILELQNSLTGTYEAGEVWSVLETIGARYSRYVRSVSPRVLEKLQTKSRYGPFPPISDLGKFWSVEFDVRHIPLDQLVDTLVGMPAVANVHLEEGDPRHSEGFNRASSVPVCQVRDLGTEAFRKRPGGGGEHASLADVEGGWELRSPWYKIAHPRPIWGVSRFQSDRLHGEKTLSVLVSQGHSRYPETGIAPGLSRSIRLSSYVTSPNRCDTTNAILAAIVRLIECPGSILLLEVTRGACHRRTPAVSLPTEVFVPDLHAIRLATSLGITVVEAAGNGARGEGINLDDRIEVRRQLSSVSNRTIRRAPSAPCDMESGAILVASADLEISGEGRSVRLTPESNFGSGVTCASIGRGLAVLKRDSNVELGVYGGTSAASAVIAGMLAVIQSIRKRQMREPALPCAFREQLSDISRTSNDFEYRTPTAHDLIERFVNN